MTDVAVATRQGRDLIPAELFDRLTTRIVRDHHLDQATAEQVMDQALAFLAACATTTEPIGPSDAVDVGWHTFILHTRDYAQFCQRIAGRFIHHEPEEGGTTRTGAPLPRAVAVIRNAGYRLDPGLWGTAADCNVSGGGGSCSQCHAGCTDSPRT